MTQVQKNAMYRNMSQFLSNDGSEYDTILIALKDALEYQPNLTVDLVEGINVWEKLEFCFIVSEFCGIIGLTLDTDLTVIKEVKGVKIVKYLHLTSNDDLNIAVIKCNDKGNVSAKKVKIALSQHYDFDITIDSIVMGGQHPLSFTVKYSYNINDAYKLNGKDEPEDIINSTAQLNETWLY